MVNFDQELDRILNDYAPTYRITIRTEIKSLLATVLHEQYYEEILNDYQGDEHLSRVCEDLADRLGLGPLYTPEELERMQP